MLDYHPSRLFRNGHVNTIAAASTLRKAYALKVSHTLRGQAENRVLSLADNVQLHGFLNSHNSSGTKPLVMLLHGWLGCADSLYLLPLASHLHALGFNIFRLNFRDHGGTQHLNKELFHSCRLEEVLCSIQAIQNEISHTKFSLIGFSLGGNFALRIGALAKERNLTIDKIISVCPVMNPANALDETKPMLKIYSQYYLRRWKKMLRAKHKFFPNDYEVSNINKEESLNSMTEHLLLQYTEFDSLNDYLQGYAITGERLKFLSVKSDVFIAEDDPVIPSHDYKNLYASENLNIRLTRFGGHCGYLNGLFNINWIDAQIVKRIHT